MRDRWLQQRQRLGRLARTFGSLSRGVDPGLIRRLLKNAGLLFGSGMAGAVLGLAGLSLTARALGPAELGQLQLIRSYVITVGLLLAFSTWQAVIKFAAEAREQGDSVGYRQVIKGALLLDMTTGMLSLVAAVVALPRLAPLWGWDESARKLALLYSLVLLIRFDGPFIAVLQVAGRFGLLATVQVVNAVCRTLAILVCYVRHEGMVGFFIIWMLTDLLVPLAHISIGTAELRRQGHGGFWKTPLKGLRGRFDGLLPFVFSTNLTLSLQLGAQQIDALIVGAFLDSSAVGLYQVAKKFASIPFRVQKPLTQASYPDLAAAWAADRQREFAGLVARLVRLLAGPAFLIWLFVTLSGEWILRITSGPEFVSAAPLMSALMCGSAIAVVGAPLRPALLATGQAVAALWLKMICVGIYLPVLLLTIRTLGLLGAGYASIVYYLGEALLCGLTLARQLARARRRPAPEVPPQGES